MFLCIFSNTLEKNTSTDLIYITKTSEKNLFFPDVFVVNCQLYLLTQAFDVAIDDVYVACVRFFR